MVTRTTWHLALFAAVLGLGPAYAISARDEEALSKAPAGETFRGRARLPDFAGRDRQFEVFRTRITAGMKAGANFAGRLALIEIGCGSSCRFVYAGDLRSGEVYPFPLGGEDNLSLHLYYRPESRAVVAYWQDAGRCLRNVVTWTGSEFRTAKAADIGDQEVCYALVD